mmetsp:Transcript_82602/g.208383  ORF Transcript_82602/g.208383 Transcript_82602/m.208383 type:complete len:82 (+) Transcript_82602:716-961(+)
MPGCMKPSPPMPANMLIIMLAGSAVIMAWKSIMGEFHTPVAAGMDPHMYIVGMLRVQSDLSSFEPCANLQRGSLQRLQKKL